MHTSDSIAHENHLLGSLLGLVALAALLGLGANAVNRMHRRRMTDRDAPLSGREQAWESEGGRTTAADQPGLMRDPTPDLAP